MMGIVSSGTMIAMFAIAAPFIFVLCVILIVTGRKKEKDKAARLEDDELETMEEIYKGLKDLNKRIENLETLFYDRKNKERQ